MLLSDTQFDSAVPQKPARFEDYFSGVPAVPKSPTYFLSFFRTLDLATDSSSACGSHHFRMKCDVNFTINREAGSIESLSKNY